MKKCRKTIKPLLKLVSLESRRNGIVEGFSGLAIGLVSGTLIGGLAGVLFAPAKGSITRKRSKRKLLRAKNTVEEGFEDAVDSVVDITEHAEDYVEESVEKAVDMKNKVGKAGSAAKKELTK